MENKQKNVKISDKHHEKLKNYCDENGYKLYKVVEKWIDKYCNYYQNTLSYRIESQLSIFFRLEIPFHSCVLKRLL